MPQAGDIDVHCRADGCKVVLLGALLRYLNPGHYDGKTSRIAKRLELLASSKMDNRWTVTGDEAKEVVRRVAPTEMHSLEFGALLARLGSTPVHAEPANARGGQTSPAAAPTRPTLEPWSIQLDRNDLSPPNPSDGTAPCYGLLLLASGNESSQRTWVTWATPQDVSDEDDGVFSPAVMSQPGALLRYAGPTSELPTPQWYLKPNALLEEELRECLAAADADVGLLPRDQWLGHQLLYDAGSAFVYNQWLTVREEYAGLVAQARAAVTDLETAHRNLQHGLSDPDDTGRALTQANLEALHTAAVSAVTRAEEVTWDHLTTWAALQCQESIDAIARGAHQLRSSDLFQREMVHLTEAQREVRRGLEEAWARIQPVQE